VPDAPRDPYQYAIVRLVPRVERGECLNVGIVLLCRSQRYIGARTVLDEDRLRALAPEVDPAAVRPHLLAIESIARGEPEGGSMATLTPAERFHWLVAPASTIIPPSAVHTGLTADAAAELEHLVDRLVR
jgi:hypothetical protein